MRRVYYTIFLYLSCAGCVFKAWPIRIHKRYKSRAAPRERCTVNICSVTEAAITCTITTINFNRKPTRTANVVIAYSVAPSIEGVRISQTYSAQILIFRLLNSANLFLGRSVFSIFSSTLSSKWTVFRSIENQNFLWKWFHRWARNGKCSLNAWSGEKIGKKMSKQNNECEPTNRFQALKDNDDPFLLLLFRNILVGNALTAFEMCSNQNELMQNAYSVIAFTHTYIPTYARV